LVFSDSGLFVRRRTGLIDLACSGIRQATHLHFGLCTTTATRRCVTTVGIRVRCGRAVWTRARIGGGCLIVQWRRSGGRAVVRTRLHTNARCGGALLHSAVRLRIGRCAGTDVGIADRISALHLRRLTLRILLSLRLL
ncbi:hypothetical protein NLO50_25190, partial [Escherichia coli]|nr:hypothetical protein [Escherichia coli]